MIKRKLKISPYYKRLIGKIEREIQFRKDNENWKEVAVGEAKLEEIYGMLEEKAAREEKTKHASDPPKYHYIHKIVDLNKMVENLLLEFEDCRLNANLLALKVWKAQNPKLSEHTTGFIDFAEALLLGKYADYSDILEAKINVQRKNTKLKIN